MRIIISGGGTGGHVFPAIAIADALKVKAPDTEILFVGAEGKLEMEKVPKAGFEIIGLQIAGFQRKWTLKNLSFPFKLTWSLWKARRIIRDFKPDVAVGVGGYASGPLLKMANLAGIKTILQEQNSYAGVTNRLLADKASKICVAYDGMERFFPKEKIVFTGNPVRSSIFEKRINREDAKLKLNLPANNKTILLFGGSLGAETLNEAIHLNFEKLKQTEGINLIWQAGKLYYDKYKTSPVADLDFVKLVPFIEDMDIAYAAADLVVCRAGAMTISELAVLGKAAILVPSPNVAEDHQTVNAMSLVNKDAAVIVKDRDARSRLVETMLDLVGDEHRLNVLQKNILFYAKPDAAIKIAEEILKLT